MAVRIGGIVEQVLVTVGHRSDSCSGTRTPIPGAVVVVAGSSGRSHVLEMHCGSGVLHVRRGVEGACLLGRL